MAFSLGPRSRFNLRGVHPDLISVVELAITLTTVDFTVLEGLRTVARQKQLVAQGSSRTLNSRHITGHAVDVVPYIKGKISWRWNDYPPVVQAMKDAAAALNIQMSHGADWTSFPDGPHHELNRAAYPAPRVIV